MLQKLSVRNYAIIDDITIEPDKHLNTITGETGAGKSIILGALSLILGDRADTSVLINKEEKCVVEGFFNVANNDVFRQALNEENLDEELVCIIRREISASGKSRAFVNDTPVTLSVLNKLTSLLVDLHQQFGHLALQNDSFQLDVLDAVAQNGKHLSEYTQLYNKYKKVQAELKLKEGQQQQWQKDADYKQFLLEELEQLQLKENDIEEAEQKLKQLSNAGVIIQTLEAAKHALDEGEHPIVNELKKTANQIYGIADVLPDTKPLFERINSVVIELRDVADEVQRLQDAVPMDAELMQQMQERVDAGYKLFKKHGVNSTTELLEIQSTLREELKESLDLEETIAELRKDLSDTENRMLKAGEQLAESRKKAADPLAKRINELMALVGMPNAVIKISVTKSDTPLPTGLDVISFQLDANKSGRFLPIYKAASGGEMSRIMLCIKSLTAQAMQLPTLIFDEVDTGISGEAARQVGLLLRDLAQYHQVICITHQPQVAAKGTAHFYVYKSVADSGKIKTRIKLLDENDRVLAIARMIGGETPSEAAMQNARELVAV